MTDTAGYSEFCQHTGLPKNHTFTNDLYLRWLESEEQSLATWWRYQLGLSVWIERLQATSARSLMIDRIYRFGFLDSAGCQAAGINRPGFLCGDAAERYKAYLQTLDNDDLLAKYIDLKEAIDNLD
jgi:hypothetical protein